MDISDSGKDRSLTADEAQTWRALERSLRLRPRLRYRVAALSSRLVHNPIIVAGVILILASGLLAGAALLPVTTDIIAAASAASLGVCVLLVGVVQVTWPQWPRAMWRRRRH